MSCMVWCHKVTYHTKYEGCSPNCSRSTGIYAYLRSKVIQVTWHFVNKLCSHSNLCVPKVTPVALLVCLELHMLIYMLWYGTMVKQRSKVTKNAKFYRLKIFLSWTAGPIHFPVIIYCACTKYEHNQSSHVYVTGENMVKKNGCQSAIFDHMKKLIHV